MSRTGRSPSKTQLKGTVTDNPGGCSSSSAHPHWRYRDGERSGAHDGINARQGAGAFADQWAGAAAADAESVVSYLTLTHAPDAVALAARDSLRHLPPMNTRRLRIIYADDDALMRRGVSRLLAAEGIAVRACASGGEAIALCQQTSPDVVLLDIHMPDIDGVETARRLRCDPSTSALRLVALTGRGTWDLRKKAMDAGFDEFLSKPIPADVLLGALRG